MVSSEEEWRDVAGYEGHYSISNTGVVKSLRRPVSRGIIQGIIKEKLLKPHWAGDRTKYLCVLLSKGGVKEKKKIHHLVLESFVGGKPFQNAVARHLDDNPCNNHVGNLKWGTVSENAIDKFSNGYEHQSICLTDLQTISIFNDCRSQRDIAREYGVSQTTVWRVKNGLYCS